MISPKIAKMQSKRIRKPDASRRVDRQDKPNASAVGIAASIAMYRLKEIALFELIERQEALAMAHFGKAASSDKATDTTADTKTEDANMRNLVPLVQKASNVDFINGTRAKEIALINDLEQQIDAASTVANQMMFQILDLSPQSHTDAKAKLRFISSMFLDGADIEANYLSQLMDECIDVLDDKQFSAPPS